MENKNEETDSNKLNNKINILENNIKTLKLENRQLNQRVKYLEDLVKKLCEKENIITNFSSLPTIQINNLNKNNNTNIVVDIKKSTPIMPHIINKGIKIVKEQQNLNEISLNEKEETWLYYILNKPKMETNKIISLLNINDPDKSIFEISTKNIINEIDLYINLLEINETFKEYKQDFKSMEFNEVIYYFEDIFSVTLLTDTVIIIRDIPSKKNNKYEHIMIILSSLIEKMHNIFNNLINQQKNEESYGKMKLVLETEEDLNIVNLIQNNSRILLSLEKLNTK